MTAPARLLSVRLQGFKSFAERTHVAFGPGISAVVGPNGSGKSNLADALRWALGEQGRALRTRKAEDVIWAGSERRPALGMADVQLVLDNADGLLPVEFGVVELGRRLFRSGENEYVLNRQRVRLRDLVDLLDAAHLAENAFLFIGQGMVDQALALRPEERRPLFEEVAGVRRHERRRRRAEEQLAESEANLARVEDVVTELRPQVRRLAAQADQQASRRSAGEELAAALLAAAHGRWHIAAGRVARAEGALSSGRGAIEAAMTDLTAREGAAAGFAELLAERAATDAEARREVDAAREALTAARLTAGAVESEATALDRDRLRLDEDRVTVERGLAADRQLAAVAVPAIDVGLDAELREAEAGLAAATAELGEARASTQAVDAERAAAQRAEASYAAELDLARRRHQELERQLADETTRAAAAEQATATAAEADRAAAGDLTRALAAEATSRQAERAAAATAQAASASVAAASEHAAGAASRRASASSRLDALAARLAAIEGDALGLAALAAGGRRLDDGLVIEPALRNAAAAALGASAAGFVVSRPTVTGLASQHGPVVVSEALAREADDAAAGRAAHEALLAAVRRAGGGRLLEAVRSDPTAAARRLLARAVWLPDLAACLDVQPLLPAGWIATPRDGSAIVGEAVVELRPEVGVLALRAEAKALAGELATLEANASAAAEELDRTTAELARTQAAEAAAHTSVSAAAEARRAAEATAAQTGRRAEVAGREEAWLVAQLERLRAGVARAAEAGAILERGGSEGPAGLGRGADAPHGFSVLERRVEELRQRRDRLDAIKRTADAARRDAERDRTRAEAGVTIGERRLAEIEASIARLAARDAELVRSRAEARRTLEVTTTAADAAVGRLDALLALDARDRAELGGAERAAVAARGALQALQEASRGAEREELEARLGFESLREQLLVELAGLGDLGLRHLGAAGPAATGEVPDDGSETSADVVRLEAALDVAAAAWTSQPPQVDVPTPGRLAGLRRRFHELGAANPFALEEHAALSARLESLESQRSDLLAAVARTRELIAELDTLIASQFRSTFGALERAFDARFRQLFGGGFARLALTDPGDLAATGIEITARPPGKKPQALAMLSGGERALTAVALLFAMLEIRPVPFCVLDEVDAALDEANIGRFTDALRELTARTQFVVITHNRGTIETADALYGVTVGDDSVSRVISLRLEEATAIGEAAAAGSRRAPIIPAGLAEAGAEAAG